MKEFDEIGDFDLLNGIDEDSKTKIGKESLEARPPQNLQIVIRVLEGNEKGMDFPVKDSPTFIGRDRLAGVPISDPKVSRQHATIFFEKSQFNLKDLGSTNGTFLNGNQITETPLQDGDMLQIGDTICQVMIQPAPQSPRK
jgi:pSer/pThr/pTyr-binding forkhead associated (FHA) protein